ncbi:hypothetical protein MesoLjLb_22530 [Mesorhizobium sp. L-8-3]|nr:hypothetical protein MesoLjLb_22530 [Mesorhizobium sp. L-8-3]
MQAETKTLCTCNRDIELTSGTRSVVTGFRPLCDAPEIFGRTEVRDRAGGQRNWKNPANVSTKTGLPGRGKRAVSTASR